MNRLPQILFTTNSTAIRDRLQHLKRARNIKRLEELDIEGNAYDDAEILELTCTILRDGFYSDKERIYTLKKLDMTVGIFDREKLYTMDDVHGYLAELRELGIDED